METRIFVIIKDDIRVLQKIEVIPIGYVNSDVTCEIADKDLDICFSVPIDRLETETGLPVTRKLLSKLFGQ